MDARIIEFSVISDGRSLEQISNDLKNSGVIFSKISKEVIRKLKELHSKKCRYNLVIMSGRSVCDVTREAKLKNFLPCENEIGLLVQEQIPKNKIIESGFNMLVAMHKPIEIDSILSEMRLYIDVDENSEHDIGVWNSRFDNHSTMGRLPKHRGLIFIKNTTAI